MILRRRLTTSFGLGISSASSIFWSEASLLASSVACAFERKSSLHAPALVSISSTISYIVRALIICIFSFDISSSSAKVDATSSATSFDTVVDYSSYSYKKINHFVSWCQHVQAREVHRVPDDILEAVMKDLYERQNIRKLGDITQKRVRETLRRLKLRKAYDHVTQVTARISGIRPPRISAATEEQLKNLFLQMQPAFQRHAPKSRTNFLSYSYVLYRCFQMLGLHHMLESITLLKGRDKLEANDAIFRKMAEDLGWPVYDLPPVVVA